ncbi:MAG: SulP family inorganic anion transporter [Anaerolineae bacterium]|nr:SulP family inorganic anion transporter [Anaerolineae bacterium]
MKRRITLPRHTRQDLIAGLTGAVAGAPQAMGFALIAGVNPVYGLYTALVATVVGALVGSSTFMTVGPTNALALVVASSLSGYGEQAQVSHLFTLTLLVGLFVFLFGVLRLGMLIRFVSNAVMTGFITGAGLLIILGQVQHITGYDAQGGSTLLRFIDWLSHLGQSQPHTTIIGLGALVTITLLHRTRLHYLATLIAILLATLATGLLGWGDVAYVQDLSVVPRGLPGVVLPDLRLMPDLAASALAIAVLAAVQSAALTNSVSEPDGSMPDATRDLIGIGLANLAGGLLQGMPACGSLSRTAVNINAGARTRRANVYAGLFVGLFLLALGSVIEAVTLAALAAHLIVAAFSLLRPDQIMLVWRVNWPARIAMTATLAATLLLPLEYSIYVGVLLSLALYVYSASEKLHVTRLVPIGENRYRTAPVPEHLPDHEVIIFSVRGHLYFAAVSKLEKLLPAPESGTDCVVILRLRESDYLGSTGIGFLRRYNRQLREHGGQLILTGLSRAVRKELEQTGMTVEFGEDNLFDAEEIYLDATAHAFQYGQSLLKP